MSFRFPLRPMLGAALCSMPVLAIACGGRGALDTDIAAYDAPDASALFPGSGDDGGEAPTDSGAKLGPKRDAGKDAGLPGIPGLPGFPGLLGADAGALGACFACAQQSCGTQVNACVGSPACVQEGLCDITQCVGGAGATGGGTMGGTGLGGLNVACFSKCGSNQQASQELLSAAVCVFGSCGPSCLGAVTSFGGGGGGLGGLNGPGLGGPVPGTAN